MVARTLVHPTQGKRFLRRIGSVGESTGDACHATNLDLRGPEFTTDQGVLVDRGRVVLAVLRRFTG